MGEDEAKTRVSNAQRTARSDARMFQAAIELILERGAQRTTLKDIGERAGYSRGLAGARFGSKENLFTELIERTDKPWNEMFREKIKTQRGLAIFKTSMDLFGVYLFDDVPAYRAALMIRFESLGADQSIQRRNRERMETMRIFAEAAMQDAIDLGEVDPTLDPKLFAIELVAFSHGLMYQFAIDSGAIKNADILQYHFESFCRAYKVDI